MTMSLDSNLIQSYNRNKMKEVLAEYVAQGQKVVLFGHGSGTLASNAIYSYMSAAQKNSIAQVSISAYVSGMSDGSTAYLTHGGDLAYIEIVNTGLFGTPLNYNRNTVI